MYAAAAAIVVEDREDLAQGVALLGDPDGQVRTIEAEHELLGVAAAQDLDDVAPGRRVGGRREGRDRDPGKARPDRKSTKSELQSLMRLAYAVFCLKKKTKQ